MSNNVKIGDLVTCVYPWVYGLYELRAIIDDKALIVNVDDPNEGKFVKSSSLELAFTGLNYVDITKQKKIKEILDQIEKANEWKLITSFEEVKEEEPIVKEGSKIWQYNATGLYVRYVKFVDKECGSVWLSGWAELRDDFYEYDTDEDLVDDQSYVSLKDLESLNLHTTARKSIDANIRFLKKELRRLTI